MNGASDQLESRTAGFGIAAAIVALFNTALACVKDAYHPLNSFMNRLAGHNWTTQAICDVLLFFVLGFAFSRSALSTRFAGRLSSALIVAVVLAGAVLFAWYALY
jgi:hypothetical protein